ncbi:MAG: hypothetical protein JWM99_1450 [Verrucomicrobiales bacterium]|jgi:hypothetical protein|nr:hypothetical protein [Verrucomicrobiales bacterium]
MKPESNAGVGRNNKQGLDRGITRVPGQNPRQNDAVDHDENNDQNRVNKLKTPSQNK